MLAIMAASMENAAAPTEDEPVLLVQLACGAVLRVRGARRVHIETDELVIENGGERARFPLGDVIACSATPFQPVPD